MPIARLVLEGEIAFKAGDRDRGLDLLKQAVELEETFVYAEPAPWMMPARHAYGALLNIEGRYKESEAVYLRDLEIFPANGWALLGLRDSLIGQGRASEAAYTDQAFRRAWKSADVMPPASCYCGEAVVAAE
jgi:tetratricopeptide (TPR) repeat protein